MTNPLAAAAAARARAQAEPPRETGEQVPPRLHVVTDADPADDAAEAQVAAANAEAQERALQAAVDRYIAMLPEIEAAQPIPAQVKADTAEPRLTGAAWVADGVRRMLTPPLGKVAAVDVRTRDGDVKAVLTFHTGVDEDNRLRVGSQLAEMLHRRGNLGEFSVGRGHDETVLLYRVGIDGVGPWRSHGARAAEFNSSRAEQKRLFALAGVVQKNPDTGNPQTPTISAWGEDDRGGTCQLSLPPGMVLDQVRRAEPGLRQVLNAPELTVTAKGVHPVLHLNTKKIVNEFPKQNPMRPGLFVRPRTPAERHAAAGDFVIPLGVRADGSPILVQQSVAPHMGIFGGTGMGKTVLLSQLVQAAVLQGAEVLLVDAKNGKDLRRIAMQNLPGVVHYSSGSEATLHRAVRYVRDEFERRKALAARLQQDGIEYLPTPLLLVFDEAPAWLDDQMSGSDKEARKAAEQTIANLSWIASQAREQKCFILTAGQYAYASAFAGRWKSNTQTLVVLGPPSEINRQALFAAGEPREQVKVLGAQLTKSMKGRGIMADTETGEIQLFQGFFNAGADADTFTAALASTPRLRRFAWRFPTGSDPGGDGSWQDWTPTSEPSSDDLPVLHLDGPDGRPDPASAMYDPIGKSYAPGSKPLRAAHAPVN
ncbi:FtsK/SpoIIIE domain-containing protein [Mycobacterium aquaticum]|uniref:FtsK/SpoIIIE domain-containing protein n=1 Tax=Mycobacterium aquaticum TaxID=1927124 RepID=UPI001154E6A3|nr:FtsK/SpoIIIE domain-containing protein [Mycobacterium aquaticum]